MSTPYRPAGGTVADCEQDVAGRQLGVGSRPAGAPSWPGEAPLHAVSRGSPTWRSYIGR